MKTINLESFVIDICQKEGWDTDPYKDLTRAIEEMGEVAREIRRIEEGRQRPDEVEGDKELIKQDIASEIGDVLFPLVKICNHYGFSLEDAIKLHVDKMTKRYEK